MSIGLWIAVVAGVALIGARCLRQLVGRRLRGRTRQWRVCVRRDGRLAARGWRLRLYGVAPFDDEAAIAFLRAAVAGRPMRWRVLAIDGDGTLVVVLRCAGASQAIALLRAGLARTLGSGARCHRHAQAQAQAKRRGVWRLGDGAKRREPCPGRIEVPVLRWW